MLKRLFSYLSFTLALLCAAVNAQETPAELEYSKFNSQNQGEIQLDTGTRLTYEVTRREIKDSTEVITAKLLDPYAEEFEQYLNLVVILDRNSTHLQGFAETTEGHFQFNAVDDDSGLWKKTQAPKESDPLHIHPQTSTVTPSMANAELLALGEKDASGRYVIDVFIGFSEAAAAYVGNIETAAQMYIETVNTALKNSQIDTVYLRLVGTGISPHNPGVVTSVLRDGKIWFAEGIERTAPDLLGLIQMPTDDPDSAGGWAGVTGDSHVIGAPWPGAYRHEVGHNAGGIHCKGPTDTGYHFGFSVRQGRGTIQCGNDLSYYSSPTIRDEEGNLLGASHSQDMARVWRERAAEMSANRLHKIPFPGDNQPITLQAEDYTGFSDTTPGNTGGAYRNNNVDIQTTSDSDGSYNVGWIASGEWLAYKVKIPSDGKYLISYRVASLDTQGRIQFEQQGGNPVFGIIDVPITGGWQKWTTITQEVTLKAGEQSVALAFKTGNFNLNWIKIEKVGSSLGTFRLQNLWQPTQFIHIENGHLETGDVPAGYWSSQWNLEPVTGTQFVRIVNRWKPTQSLHIENGVLEAGAANRDWFSNHWQLELAYKGEYRLKNRFKPELYINFEGNRLQVSSIQSGWRSALWTLVATSQ